MFGFAMSLPGRLARCATSNLLYSRCAGIRPAVIHYPIERPARTTRICCCPRSKRESTMKHCSERRAPSVMGLDHLVHESQASKVIAPTRSFASQIRTFTAARIAGGIGTCKEILRVAMFSPSPKRPGAPVLAEKSRRFLHDDRVRNPRHLTRPGEQTLGPHRR